MKRILVIEDEQHIRNSLLTLLSQKGFMTNYASDGHKGLQLASTEKFDAIILDYKLPKADGLHVCTKLRNKRVYLPILILTATDELEFRVKFLHSGADDYLTKPFITEELCARLTNILKRPSLYHHHLLKEKNIALNSLTQRVTKNNIPINLTKKEFSILEYLLRFKGTIISRNNLFEHVWDKHADIFSNSLEAHILSLRKKLGFKREEFIKCISGRGYMLEI